MIAMVVAMYFWCGVCVLVAIKATKKEAESWIGRKLPADDLPPLVLAVVVVSFWWLAPVLQYAFTPRRDELREVAKRAFQRKMSLDIPLELTRAELTRADMRGAAKTPDDTWF
jgi:uncharacterized membrane protein